MVTMVKDLMKCVTLINKKYTPPIFLGGVKVNYSVCVFQLGSLLRVSSRGRLDSIPRIPFLLEEVLGKTYECCHQHTHLASICEMLL